MLDPTLVTVKSPLPGVVLDDLGDGSFAH